MAATSIRTWAWVGVVAVVALGACNRVGDAYCEVGTDLSDLTDQCPFGPPGGPGTIKEKAECPPIQQKLAADCANVRTWSETGGIWDQINTSGCSAAGSCHDGHSKHALSLKDASSAYDELKTYKGPNRTTYISETNPGQTWILCNLQKDQKSGGAIMPPGTGVTGTALDAVKSWAACGEKKGAPGGGVGGGGGGGVGGGGGAGGGVAGAGGI